MATTFTKIASVSVGSGGASSAAFTSIPSTYTDLKVVFSARTNASTGSAGELSYMAINSDTNVANYDYRSLRGNGSVAASFSGGGNYAWYNDPSDYTANTFGSGELYICNYLSSAYKSYTSDGVTENNATASYAILNAMLWKNTSAITSLTFTPYAGNYVQYSTFTLYGIKNS
jgi:hypothetical protein